MALANSRNVPAAGVLAVVGLDEGYAFLRALGLHDNDESGRRYGLGLSIGAMPVTLERLVHAYTVLAGGTANSPANTRSGSSRNRKRRAVLPALGRPATSVRLWLATQV